MAPDVAPSRRHCERTVNDPVRQLLFLAREHLARRDPTAAETLLREVLRQRGDDAEAHHLLGLVLHARDDLASARESFQRALAHDPTNAEAALHLAITCNELGLYAEARAVSGSVSASRSASERLTPFERARLAGMHAEVARCYEHLSLFDEAAHEYRKGIALRPDDGDLHTRLGVVLRSAGDIQGACTALEAGTERCPAHAPGFVALGLTYFRLGRREDAERVWRHALALDASQRPAEVYLRMLDEDPEHLPSMLPPQPPRGDDEFANLQVSVLGDRRAS